MYILLICMVQIIKWQSFLQDVNSLLCLFFVRDVSLRLMNFVINALMRRTI
jgi:hypothetical protein